MFVNVYAFSGTNLTEAYKMYKIDQYSWAEYLLLVDADISSVVLL